MPHFQVVLGGEWEHNAGSYGLPVVAIPSKNIPRSGDSPDGAIRRRPHERRDVQGFREAHRQSRAEKHARRSRASRPPIHDRSFFSDWGDPREYTLEDIGRANARERWCPRWNSIWPPPNAKCSRRRWRWKRARSSRRADRAYRSMLRRREGAGEDRIFDHFGRSRRKSSPNFARDFTTRRNSSIRSRAGNSRNTFSPRTKRSQRRQAAVHAGLDALPDRRSAAFHRRRAQLLQPHGNRGEPCNGGERAAASGACSTST